MHPMHGILNAQETQKDIDIYYNKSMWWIHAPYVHSTSKNLTG